MNYAISVLLKKLHDLQIEKRMWKKQIKEYPDPIADKVLIKRIDFEIEAIELAIKVLQR